MRGRQRGRGSIAEDAQLGVRLLPRGIGGEPADDADRTALEGAVRRTERAAASMRRCCRDTRSPPA